MAGFTRGPKQGNGGVLESTVNHFTKDLFSTAPAGKYVSGARVKLKINEDLVYFADRISWRMETEAIEIREIDSMAPYEIAPITVGCSGLVSGLRIPNQGIAALMYQANVMAHLFQQYITIEVRDTSSDALLLYVGKAMITSRDESVQAEQLMSSQFSWRAVAWKDEMEPMLPPGVVSKETIAGLQPPSTGLLGSFTSTIASFGGPKKLF